MTFASFPTHIDRQPASTIMVPLAALVIGIALIDVIFAAGLEGSPFPWALELTQEDGVIESISALAYLCGFGVCVYALLRGPRTLTLGVWALLCFLFLGEETSWFQRIFGYHVDAVEQINAQSEFNLHNLPGLKGIGWRDVNSVETFMRAFFGSQNLFQMGFVFFFLVLPVLSKVRFTQPLQRFVGYYPPAPVSLYVIWGLIMLTYVCVTFASGELHKDSLVETRELVFSGAIASYAWLLFKSGRSYNIGRNTQSSGGRNSNIAQDRL